MKLSARDRKRLLDFLGGKKKKDGGPPDRPFVYENEDDFPYPIGAKLVVKPERLWITFLRLRRNKKGKWVADYLLIDWRNPYHGIKSKRFDEETGKHEYEPERVGPAFEKRISDEAQDGITLRQMQQRAMTEKIRLERRLQDARLGDTSKRTIRTLARHHKSLKRNLDEAA